MPLNGENGQLFFQWFPLTRMDTDGAGRKSGEPRVASNVRAEGRGGRRRAEINHPDTKNVKVHEQVRNETLRTATGTVALPNHFNTMNRMHRDFAKRGKKRIAATLQAMNIFVRMGQITSPANEGRD
jgi:hypothetical protein